MSHTKSALILAQQHEIKELQAEIHTLRERQCEHCRDYYPVLREDAIFVGNRQFTRDGLFSAFVPPLAGDTREVLEFEGLTRNTYIALVKGYSRFHPLNAPSIELNAHYENMTADCIEHFRNLNAMECMMPLRLCSHAYEQWERIFRGVRAKYNSNT